MRGRCVIKHYTDYLKSSEYNNLKYGSIDTVSVYNSSGRKNTYSCALISFDIETTKVYKDGTPYTFMYIWQIGINGTAVYGRTWDELEDFLTRFNDDIVKTHQYNRDKNGNKHKCKVQFFGMIHNIAYEWAFCKRNMYNLIGDVFLKEVRQPLYFDMYGIRFIDSYQITRMSLSKLAKTYTKTQKLVGDLDYDVERSHLTALTEQELAYCENDVLILNEYQDYYIKTFLKSGIKSFVYTQTGIVRAKLKQSFACQKQITKDDIIKMYPTEREIYNIDMKYLFRGGYVHGSAELFNQVLYNIDSFDITSAHPYQICSKKFPISAFVLDKKVSRETLDDVIQSNDAFILDITFQNIHVSGKHSIESLSKCLEIKGAVVDNGRVYSADSMRVLLTDIDYSIYKMYYVWDDVNIKYVRRAKTAYLPRYVVESVLDAYETKEKLKLQNLPYMLEKIFLNSIFGSFVTKIEPYTLKYENGIISKCENDYKKEVSKRVLSPYWGIWTTAYTRFQQLSLLHELDGIYGDTDSNKCFHKDSNFDIVSSINKRIEKGNEILCKRYHKDFRLVKELGQWDYEGTYTRFKMLGAKRYLYETDGDIHITCAGLPKSVEINDPFKNFIDGLHIAECKLTTSYCDTEYSALVDGVQMSSMSGVSLVPCDFTLSVSTDYSEFIKWICKQRKVSRET